MSDLVETRASIDDDPAEGAVAVTRRIRLGTVERVRHELERVYREVRRGSLPMADGTRLTFMLNCLAKVTEVSTVERRLIELENLMKARDGNGT